ncbi:hypothetical protein [Listeria ilorinensis]|uniref:hypothetical protein n=1 Tax=Listeria ilorinensis TaxID=2867439 RepID=UPI001EF5D9AE|nr:hypothetical protein [Listeria ilorinensis]
MILTGKISLRVDTIYSEADYNESEGVGKMEERLFDVEDKIQDLELEMIDLKEQVLRLEERLAGQKRASQPGWGVVAIVAMLCGTAISIFG